MGLGFIIVGFGEVGSKRLFPNFLRCVEDHRGKDLSEVYGLSDCKFFVVDVDDSLRDYLREEYGDLFNEGKISYFNANDSGEMTHLFEEIRKCDRKVVYISTPNKYHVDYIKVFIDKVDLLLVEKPLCDNLEEARKLKTSFKEEELKKIRLVDHYLYKDAIMEFLFNFKKYYSFTGDFKYLRFKLLESGVISPHRSWLYGSGAIRDLLPHFLGILYKLHILYPKILRIDPVIVKDVTKAIYELEKPPNLSYGEKETYVDIKLKIDNYEARVKIGFGVEKDEKKLYIKGKKGEILIDVIENKIVYNDKVILYKKKVEKNREYYNISKDIITKNRYIGLPFEYAVRELEIFKQLDKYNISKKYKIGKNP